MANKAISYTGLGICILLVLSLCNVQQPLVDQHSFRQSQTGLTAKWFDWDNPLQSLLNYETPIFGVPWKVPFEFPLYQAVVSAVSNFFSVTVGVSGRIVGLFFLLATLPLLASLAKGMGLGNRFFFITAIFWLASPLYLYWGRTVMIESTAVFAGFAFLAAVERALNRGEWYWWPTALLASVLCALVKATTYPTFGLAALGLIVWNWGPRNLLQLIRDHDAQRFLLPIAAVAAIGLCTVGVTAVWTRHSDSIKMQSELTQPLTSENLRNWNFGTLAQKMDHGNWLLLLDRSIPEAVGGYWVFGFLLGAGCVLRGRRAALLLFLLFLFLLPFAIFTNLHLVHNYYQFANSFWLVMALGLSVSELSKKIPPLLSCIVIAAILLAQSVTYGQKYFPATQVKSSDAIKVARLIELNANKNDGILVLGDEWSPEVAFHTGRRALYIPSWLSPTSARKMLETIQANPQSAFGKHHPAFLVLNDNRINNYPEEICLEISKFLSAIGKHKDTRGIRVGDYEVFKTAANQNGLKISQETEILNLVGLDSTDRLVSLLAKTELSHAEREPKHTANGLSIAAGTKMQFLVKDKFGRVKLEADLVKLPLDVPLGGGVVGLEVMVDGRPQGRKIVDRNTKQQWFVDLSNATDLSLAVDTANGTDLWDWVVVRIEDSDQ